MNLVLFVPCIVTAVTHIHQKAHHLYNITHCLCSWTLLHVSAIYVIRILLSHWYDVVLSCNLLWMLLTNFLHPFSVWSCLPHPCVPRGHTHLPSSHIVPHFRALSHFVHYRSNVQLGITFFSEQFMVTVFQLPEKVMTSLYRRGLWKWSSVSLAVWSAAN